MNYTDLPVGFAMALAQNNDALQKFSALSDSEKQQIVDRAHTANSRREMQNLVTEIENN